MVFASQTFHLNNWFGAVMGKYMFGDNIYAFYKVFRYVWIMDYCRFWSSGMPCSILRVFGDSIQSHWGFGEFFIIPCVSMWALFLYCVGPIHWETNLREAIVSLRKVKGSLLGGVLFELLTRVIPQGFCCQQNWRKSAKFAYASLPMRELSSMDTQSQGINAAWVYKMPRPRSLVCKDPGHRSGHFINQGSWSGHFTTKYKPEKAWKHGKQIECTKTSVELNGITKWPWNWRGDMGYTGKHKGITGDTPGIDRVWVYKMPRPRSLVCKDPGVRPFYKPKLGLFLGYPRWLLASLFLYTIETF